MMKRNLTLAAVAAAVLTLSACGESSQESNAAGVGIDAAPYTGVGASQYAQGGWKAGDRTSWEQQLKTRLQMGQNDYNKVN